MKQLSEKQIESQILDWLNLQPGVFAFKVNTTGIWDTNRNIFRRVTNKHIHKGTADIIGVKEGKFFCIEVKTPLEHKKMNKDNLYTKYYEQSSFIWNVKNCDGKAIFASSLDQVIEFMENII
jgi:Holliday junction resolvase